MDCMACSWEIVPMKKPKIMWLRFSSSIWLSSSCLINCGEPTMMAPNFRGDSVSGGAKLVIFGLPTLAARSFVKPSCQREPVVVHMIPNTKLSWWQALCFLSIVHSNLPKAGNQTRSWYQKLTPSYSQWDQTHFYSSNQRCLDVRGQVLTNLWY